MKRVEGVICDLGCGPGQVARYLKDRGAEVIGVDFSAAMIKQARLRNPDIKFVCADMRALPVKDAAWGGIAAFYSIIHTPRPQIPALLLELKRVLRPGGALLLAYHLGEGEGCCRDYWGVPVCMETTFLRTKELQEQLISAGFELLGWLERPPYASSAYQESRSYRGYVVVRNPVVG